jgi:hypothetical protein
MTTSKSLYEATCRGIDRRSPRTGIGDSAGRDLFFVISGSGRWRWCRRGATYGVIFTTTRSQQLAEGQSLLPYSLPSTRAREARADSSEH